MGQKSIRSDESFPDSPWRLTQNPWDDLGEAGGKSSDFDKFSPKSSGYIPDGESSSILGEYQPWVHPSALLSVNPEDLDIIINLVNGEQVGYLKPQYDWGLYNGRGGSNPNATGLYTYEGKELQGQWRTMRLEEVFYLLGLPPAKHAENIAIPDLPYFCVNNGTEPYIETYKFVDFLSLYGGYSYQVGSYSTIEVPFSTVNNAELDNIALYYYNYTENKWVPYDLIADVVVSKDGDDNVISGGNVRIVNPDAHYYDVLNSDRYDSEGNPQYAVVTIIDKETMTTMEFIAILPDGWEDPFKNESSADGKIVKGLNVTNNTNVYTKERWKFFMEPSGAVLIESKYLFPRTFEGYISNFDSYSIDWRVSNRGIIWAFSTSGQALVKQAVHLVQDAN